MSYTLPSKEFYRNPENYKVLYKNYFENESSVYIAFKIKGNDAFFVLNNEIHYTTSSI